MAINPQTGLPYNPRAYVPGGSSQQVAQAIQNQGYKTGGGSFSGVGSAGTPTPGANPFLTVPGFTPDYKSLIGTDPIFSQLKSELSAQGIGDAAARAAATQRAFGQFGIAPDMNQLGGLNQDYLNADITPEARTLAEQNTASGMSITARQQKQFQDNLRAIKNALAARGALRSGEAGHQLGEAQREFDTARFDTTQELLDYLAGVQRGFVDGERQRQQQASQGAESALNRQIPLNPARPDRQARWNGSGYVFEDGSPVPRDLWPDNGPTAATAPAAPAAPPASSTFAPAGVQGGLTADADARRQRQLLEGLLF